MINLLMLPFKALVVFLPWPIKRHFLHLMFGYQLHPTSRISFSWIYPKHLRLASGSCIGSFNVAINLDLLDLGEFSTICRGNWITGFPVGTDSPHFAHQKDRCAELVIGSHSSITNNHYIDATNTVEIGSFTTIAGNSSQLFTHSIDLHFSRQHSKPIIIGSYCFVSTNCVILGGSVLPDYSVLGASSLLNKPFDDSWGLFVGHPARRHKDIDPHSAYFCRQTGFVI